MLWLHVDTIVTISCLSGCFDEVAVDILGCIYAILLTVRRFACHCYKAARVEGVGIKAVS